MKKILIALLVLVVIVVLAINFFLGGIVKAAVEKLGPSAMGVPVKLEKAEFRLLRGHVSLKGFALGNPEGYKSGDAISVGEITVDLVPSSLLGDTIIIKRIYVNAPEINYELGLGTSNIGKILDGMSKDKKAEGEEKKEEEAPKKEGGKKVLIEDLLVEHGKIRIAAKVTGGVGAPVPLPPIHMTDIGKEEGGAKPGDVIKKIFTAILSSVGSVATGAVNLVGDGATAVGETAVDGVKAVGSAIGGLFGGKEKKEE